MNAINCLINNYFSVVLFPVDLVTKREILEVASRASFLADFSAKLAGSIGVQLMCQTGYEWPTYYNDSLSTKVKSDEVNDYYCFKISG